MISRANRGIKFLYRDVLRMFIRKERRICRISKSVARYFNNKVIRCKMHPRFTRSIAIKCRFSVFLFYCETLQSRITCFYFSFYILFSIFLPPIVDFSTNRNNFVIQGRKIKFVFAGANFISPYSMHAKLENTLENNISIPTNSD